MSMDDTTSRIISIRCDSNYLDPIPQKNVNAGVAGLR